MLVNAVSLIIHMIVSDQSTHTGLKARGNRVRIARGRNAASASNAQVTANSHRHPKMIHAGARMARLKPAPMTMRMMTGFISSATPDA